MADPTQIIPSGDTVSQIVTLVALLVWCVRKVGHAAGTFLETLNRLGPILDRIVLHLDRTQADVARGREEATLLRQQVTALLAHRTPDARDHPPSP